MRLSVICQWSLLLLCFLLPAAQLIAQSSPPFSFTSDPRDTLGRQFEDEQRRTIDPALGRVPHERLAQERERVMKQKKGGRLDLQSAIPGMNWQERGPSNAGGRTRAVLFDPNDPTRKKVWVGSPSGGLWYTNDITDASATWTPVSDDWENSVVTCLAADPSNPLIMYAGTGDTYQSVYGGGIWKTTNGGTSWSRLVSTIPGTNYGSVSGSLAAIQRLVVNNSGQIFAATRYGVVRSADGGATWQFVLAPSQTIGVGGTKTNDYYTDLVTDLEIGTDGILYASFSPSRIYKATTTAGIAWTEITPPGVSTGEGRTELALASSTSGATQVLYAVARIYNSVNYVQDIKWFRKSVNAGISWTTVTIPTHTWGSHFTDGQGNMALSLAVDPTNANILYAGGYDWFRSVDGGTNWSSRVTTSYTYQHGLAFDPNNAVNTVLINEQGVSRAIGWGDAATSTIPVIIKRNAGYRAGDVASAAMKPSPGGDYLLTAAFGSGPSVITSPGLAVGTPIPGGGSFFKGQTIIDDNEPSIQIFNDYSSFYRYDGASVTSLFYLPVYYNGTPAYDNQSNILYVDEYLSGAVVPSTIRRVTGIGSTVGYTNFNASAQSYYLKLGNSNANLFGGYYNGLIVKYSNLSQTTPTATTIANSSQLPQYSSVSCIDVGVSDDELLVTLSNFGVSSVWYTNNGGTTWVNKDPAGSGLPDVPVRVGMFNPQNRQQVILGTDLGIWTTNDISAVNPGWTLSNTGAPLVKINQLRYRASDGRLVASTGGRGIFETNALALPYTPSSVSITSVSATTLCAGSSLEVSFTSTGPISTTTTNYDVWVSDANGSYSTQRKLGTGTSSPIRVTLPTGYNSLAYGTNYKVRVVPTDFDVYSTESQSLAIGNLRLVEIVTKDQPENSYSTGTTVCPNEQFKLYARVFRTDNFQTQSAESYTWFQNGTQIATTTSFSLLAQGPGNYKVSVKQAGCVILARDNYSVYESNFVNPTIRLPIDGILPQCFDKPYKLTSRYVGETARLQWLRDGIAIAGAVSYTYAASVSGSYSVSVTDGRSCNSVSNNQQLQFGNSLFANLRLSPEYDSVLCSGTSKGNVVIEASRITQEQVTSGYYSLNWYKNNKLYSSGTNYLLASEPGAYNAEITQGSCTARSNTIVVREGSIVPPVIINRDGINPSCLGQTSWLQVIRNYFGSYSTFQWQRNGIDISGATSDEYYTAANGVYTVRVTKGSCSVVSAPKSLTFSGTIMPELVYPIYNQTKIDGVACSEYNMTSSVYINNATYQWYKDGQPIAGATDRGYTARQSGVYSFSVSGLVNDNVCGGKSRELAVQLGRAGKPIITFEQVMGGICQNNSYRLAAQYDKGTLQWKRNGIVIPTGTPDYYDANNYYAYQPGIYTAVLQDGVCSTESDPVEIRIGEPTSASLTGGALVNSGQPAPLPVAFTGPAPWSFTLSSGQSVQNTYLNPYPLTVSPSATTSYSIAAVENACGTGTSAGQAVVTVGTGQADLSVMAQVSNRTPKVNDIVSYSLLVTNAGPQNAGNVQVTSRLPAGVEFVEAVSPSVSFANGVVSGNVASLLVGYTTPLTYHLRVTQPGVFFTAAQIASTNTPDPDSQPNSGTGDGQDDAVTVDLRTADAGGTLVNSPNPNQVPLPGVSGNQPSTSPGSVELALELRSTSLTPKAGSVLSLSLTVTNRGGAVANNVVVQTLLPSGWQLTNSTGLVVSGQTIKAYVNQLAANGRTVLVLPVVVSSGNGQVQAQVLEVAEPVANAIPGNGYQNGERDEARLLVRVR